MTNRTEILHFRATPEEKQTIRENAGHAELALSEWMRQRSLDRLVPTQPLSEQVEELRGVPGTETRYPLEVRGESETYVQFMERRVPELCGENPSVAEVGDAEIAARVEWAERYLPSASTDLRP
jgi:hypothetical protein